MCLIQVGSDPAGWPYSEKAMTSGIAVMAAVCSWGPQLTLPPLPQCRGSSFLRDEGSLLGSTQNVTGMARSLACGRLGTTARLRRASAGAVPWQPSAPIVLCRGGVASCAVHVSFDDQAVQAGSCDSCQLAQLVSCVSCLLGGPKIGGPKIGCPLFVRAWLLGFGRA